MIDEFTPERFTMRRDQVLLILCPVSHHCPECPIYPNQKVGDDCPGQVLYDDFFPQIRELL